MLVEIATVRPFASFKEVSLSASSAGRFKRPELTALDTLPVTEAPRGATRTPRTRSGAARVPSNSAPSVAVPELMLLTKRTSRLVPSGTVIDSSLGAAGSGAGGGAD